MTFTVKEICERIWELEERYELNLQYPRHHRRLNLIHRQEFHHHKLKDFQLLSFLQFFRWSLPSLFKSILISGSIPASSAASKLFVINSWKTMVKDLILPEKPSICLFFLKNSDGVNSLKFSKSSLAC